MPSITRPLGGRVLRLAMEDEADLLEACARHSPAGRAARTLLKEGEIRATLVALAPGGSVAPHAVEGPVVVQGVRGDAEVRIDGRTWPLPAGAILAIPAGIEHSVRSREGSAFLLTVARSGEAGEG